MPQISEPRRTVAQCTLSQADFDRFAELSGDHNPIHVDPAFAQATPFGATVSHGMLLFSRLRGLIAEHYPEKAFASQALMFPAPSYAGETLTLVLQEEPSNAQGLVLRTEVHKQDGRLGLQGHCVLGPPAGQPEHGGNAPRPQGGAAASPAQHGLVRFLQLAPGDTARLDRVFTAADLKTWAGLAGQSEPPGGIPEPLIAALFSCLLGEELPGHGTNYLKQSMQFFQSARVDEALSATVTITRLRADKALVDLHTRCTGEQGRVLCTGDALVLFRR